MPRFYVVDGGRESSYIQLQVRQGLATLQRSGSDGSWCLRLSLDKPTTDTAPHLSRYVDPAERLHLTQWPASQVTVFFLLDGSM